MTYSQRWLMSKRQVAREVIDNTGIKEIIYIEKYKQGNIRASGLEIQSLKSLNNLNKSRLTTSHRIKITIATSSNIFNCSEDSSLAVI